MKPRGFTLIELLVVISVIAILLSLAVPALNAVRERARTALCQTHIRDLLLELEQYSHSEDGALPFASVENLMYAPADGWAGDLTIDPAGCWWWFDLLETVNHSDLRDSGLLECPAKQLEGRAFTVSLLWGNYGVNDALCVPTASTYPGRPLVKRPRFGHEFRGLASTILIADSGHARLSWTQATLDPPDYIPLEVQGTLYIPGMDINKQRELTDGLGDDAIGGRHPGKTINIGFADGHIERQAADKLLVEKREDETYTNISPLWEP